MHASPCTTQSTKAAPVIQEPGEKPSGLSREKIKDRKEHEDATVTVREKAEEEVPVQETRKGSRKLDDNALKPWGGGTLSRSSSDTSSSGSETYFCKGGPGKKSCGDPVLDGEMGVRCDGCLAWYHSVCQAITKEALQAIEQWHPVLSWLCPECKALPKQNATPASDKLVALEAKVEDLGNFVRTHMRTVEQCLKEQERTSVEQGRLIERSIKESHQLKGSYADMVKGSCTEVLNKVSSQIASLPAHAGSKTEAKAAQDLSIMFDDFQDKEKRKMNVVVHNMKESESEVFEERAKHDAQQFEEMVKEAFRLRVTCVRSFRAGKKVPGKDRLLIVSLESVAIRQELVRMAPQLRNCEKYDGVYMNPDLSPREREQGKKLRQELAARKQKGEKNLSIRKGRIICTTPGSAGTSGRSVHQSRSDEKQKSSEVGCVGAEHHKTSTRQEQLREQ